MDKLRRAEHLSNIQQIKQNLDAEHKAKLAGIEWFLEQDKDYRIQERDVKEVIDLVQISQFVNNLKKE